MFLALVAQTMKRRKRVVIVAIDIGSVIDQELEDVRVLEFRCIKQRRTARIINAINFAAIDRYQLFHFLFVVLSGG